MPEISPSPVPWRPAPKVVPSLAGEAEPAALAGAIPLAALELTLAQADVVPPAGTDTGAAAAGGAGADAALDDLDVIERTVLGSVHELLLGFVQHVPYVISACLALLLTWALARLLDHFGPRLLGRWRKRESVKELILRLVSFLITVLGLLLAAIILFPGLTPAKALGGLGLVSIAVGLAFKDIFENFFAGLLILWRFPFERGDFIECEGLIGRVERVLVRMSYIRRTTGELVVVPNAFLFKSPVVVLTSLPVRRVSIIAGVAYDVDVPRAVEVITAAVEGCATVVAERPVEIFPQGFGESSIDIEVTWWTGSTPLDVRRSRGEVVTAVKGALDAAGIEIPFPYRTLTFKEPLPVTEMPVTRIEKPPS